MFQSMALNDYLAFALGLYLLAAAVGLGFDREGAKAMIGGFYDQPALAYLGGVMAFTMGVVLLRLHHDWSTLQNGLISLVAWGGLIEGVFLLAARRFYLGLFKRMAQSDGMITFAIVFCLMAGIYMIWSAF